MLIRFYHKCDTMVFLSTKEVLCYIASDAWMAQSKKQNKRCFFYLLTSLKGCADSGATWLPSSDIWDPNYAVLVLCEQPGCDCPEYFAIVFSLRDRKQEMECKRSVDIPAGQLQPSWQWLSHVWLAWGVEQLSGHELLHSKNTMLYGHFLSVDKSFSMSIKEFCKV